MTLTYRVQNYNQQNMAGASNKPALPTAAFPTTSDQAESEPNPLPMAGASFWLALSTDPIDTTLSFKLQKHYR